ncbi:hypothetical protein QP157_13900 [Sphingomonas sp. LR61]|uniref:hypothetical protein n=1 Tax=Sphingomonas sp. LR61 TaxID=3050234 RepID=UPI002FDF2543
MSNPGNAPAQSNTFGVVSLVLGIVGVVGGIFIALIGIIAGIIGLVLGILARKRGGSRGTVLAGIILSAVAIVIEHRRLHPDGGHPHPVVMEFVRGRTRCVRGRAS